MKRFHIPSCGTSVVAEVIITFLLLLTPQFLFAQDADASAERHRSSLLGLFSSKSASDIEKTQVRKYGENDPGFTHGYAAEDANATSDRLAGKKVRQTGQSNIDDGPDRIVGVTKVQTKYCRSANETVSTSFNKHTGMYRYPGQQLEVPKDQYEEAVKYMENKIREGKVDGVTDPADARKIVRKGKYTYEQTVKIVKAGTYESIKYDVKTGIVSSTFAFGLTFVIVFTDYVNSGMSVEEAARLAGKESLFTGSVTMAAHVIAKQLLRTEFLSGARTAIDDFGRKAAEKLAGSETGRKVLAKTAATVTGKEMAESAAIKAASNLLSSSALTGSAIVITTSIPDIWRAAHGEEEWGTVIENGVANAVGIACGVAGSAAGAMAGTAVAPGAGTAIGGFAGGVAAGMAGTVAVHKAFDLCRSMNNHDKE